MCVTSCEERKASLGYDSLGDIVRDIVRKITCDIPAGKSLWHVVSDHRKPPILRQSYDNLMINRVGYFVDRASGLGREFGLSVAVSCSKDWSSSLPRVAAVGVGAGGNDSLHAQTESTHRRPRVRHSSCGGRRGQCWRVLICWWAWRDTKDSHCCVTRTSTTTATTTARVAIAGARRFARLSRYTPGGTR